MDNQFDSEGGEQNVGIGDKGIGQQNNNYGISQEVFAGYVSKLAVTESALASFFKIMEEQQVPHSDLDSKLREIAGQYKELLARVGDDQAAKQAIERGDYAKAEQLLEDVLCLVCPPSFASWVHQTLLGGYTKDRLVQTPKNAWCRHQDQGELTKAEQYMSRAVELLEQLEHPMLENARNGLKAVRATLRVQQQNGTLPSATMDTTHD